jgi:two-component sensor histidine kinase
VELGPQTALSFSMVLHELLTNACKYGALSNEGGRIEMTWRIEENGDSDVLLSSWRETGGPIAKEPSRKGFGSKLIATSLKAYGEVEITYATEGLILLATMPLARIQFRHELDSIE